MSPRFTPGCCCDVECIIATDDYGDGSLASYTQLVGTWTEASGHVSPDTSTANQRLRFDTVTYTTSDVGVVSIRIRGGTGDQAGLMLYEDANNYVTALVTFGSGTAGRIDFNQVAGGVSVFPFDAEYECAANEYDIPPNEWVTLTIRFSDSYCFETIFNVVVEVDDTSETHTLGVYNRDVTPLLSTFKVGLITGSASTAVDFDDLSVETGSTRPTGACEHVVHCCITEEADYLGCGTDGWTISAGSWTDVTQGPASCEPPATPGDVPASDYTHVSSASALRTIDYQWLNDNLYMECGLGELEYDDPNLLAWLPEDETTWRMYFSVDGSDEWWIEARWLPEFEDEESHGLFISLEHDGTIQAWIFFILYGFDPATTPFGSTPVLTPVALPRIICETDVCGVRFGYFGHVSATAIYSLDGGDEAEGFYEWVNSLVICADDNDLNRTGKVGLGTGDEVDVSAFHNFLVRCSDPVECADYPEEEVPDPDDPDDPTGCCDGYDSLQTGDPVELTLASWAYWFGAGCADMGCSVGSDFLTDFNATHTLTLVEKTAERMRFVGNLPDNECDECDGVAVRDGVTIRMHNRATLVIEPISETECMAKVWIRGRCADCVWYFESGAFTKGADCTAITWNLISGNSNPGGYQCCLQAGTVSFALP